MTDKSTEYLVNSSADNSFINIFKSSINFAIPIFLYKIELGSTIHDIHVDVFHRSSHDAIWDFWKNGAIDLDWTGDMIQYDPFAGRIPL